MPESELWITRIFNDYLPGPANAVLQLVGKHAEARPWADFVVMQLRGGGADDAGGSDPAAAAIGR